MPTSLPPPSEHQEEGGGRWPAPESAPVFFFIPEKMSEYYFFTSPFNIQCKYFPGYSEFHFADLFKTSQSRITSKYTQRLKFLNQQS